MNISAEWVGRKLSALLGTEVHFEKFNVSLLAGTIEVSGLKVADFLTVARVVAKVAVTRALKGEIVVQSLTIERPVADLSRLPKRPDRRVEASDDSDKTKWKFDVEKVLVVDGEVKVAPKLPVRKVLFELKRVDRNYVATLLAESIVQVRGTGTIFDIDDLTGVLAAKAQATVEIGDLAKLRVSTPRIDSKETEIELQGKLTLAQLLALM
jgi:uncharacterized protein involved in outer membrane biogenesis